MAKKKTEKTMMNDYEQDCMWMSYRYCIGRHTIAAHCHALNIAKNCYGRMTDNDYEKTATDIRNEIASILRMDTFSFPEHSFHYGEFPFEHFVEWLNGKSKSSLTKIEYFYPHFDDLLVWSNLASLFDIKHHKYCKLIDGRICEYFEGYINRTEYNADSTNEIYHYDKIKIPVEEFAAGRENVYIPNESIAEDNISIK